MFADGVWTNLRDDDTSSIFIYTLQGNTYEVLLELMHITHIQHLVRMCFSEWIIMIHEYFLIAFIRYFNDLLKCACGSVVYICHASPLPYTRPFSHKDFFFFFSLT